MPPSPPRRASCPRLEGSDQDETREELPDVRLAEIYLSRAGVQRYLTPGATGATQLDTFVDYGATSGMAAGARVRDDGVQVNLVSELDPSARAAEPDRVCEPAAVRAGPRG